MSNLDDLFNEIKDDLTLEPPIPEPVEEGMGKPPEMPPEEPPEDSSKFMNEGVLDWLKGKTSASPSFLTQMMADVSNKMATYVAYLLVQRLSSLQKLVEPLAELEKALFLEGPLPSTVAGMKDSYRILSNVFKENFEFTRKFSSQSNGLIKDPERDEILQMLRALDPSALAELKAFIQHRVKGTSSSGTLKAKPRKSDFDEGDTFQGVSSEI